MYKGLCQEKLQCLSCKKYFKYWKLEFCNHYLHSYCEECHSSINHDDCRECFDLLSWLRSDKALLRNLSQFDKILKSSQESSKEVRHKNDGDSQEIHTLNFGSAPPSSLGFLIALSLVFKQLRLIRNQFSPSESEDSFSNEEDPRPCSQKACFYSQKVKVLGELINVSQVSGQNERPSRFFSYCRNCGPQGQFLSERDFYLSCLRERSKVAAYRCIKQGGDIYLACVSCALAELEQSRHTFVVLCISREELIEVVTPRQRFLIEMHFRRKVNNIVEQEFRRMKGLVLDLIEERRR